MKKIINIFIIFISLNSLVYALTYSKNTKLLELKNFEILDFPYDKGESGLIVWDFDSNEDKGIYQVYVSTISSSTGWVNVGQFNSGEKTADKINLPFWAWSKDKNSYAVKLDLQNVFEDNVKHNFSYYLKLVKIVGNEIYVSPIFEGEVKSNWFRAERLNNLILLLLITIFFFLAVSHAKKKGLFIRRIAGLDAIDEAIGRATEMGKPIFYVPGIGSMASISTIASTFILGEVSKKVAQYDSFIKVPHYDPIVMTVSKEIVKQSYIEAERPDSYREDINMFISSDQFSYAASIDGMMTREKPAACFYMGYFMAESLLLSEVGSSIGAIQIAGTDVEHQLPFFFTSCDYTLIGEELYAAGAYLSKDPMLLSALKVQDLGKFIFMILVALFSIILIFASYFHYEALIQILTNLLKVY